MILTCPECATSYFVDEARIPAEGRKVRCSTCGHRWVAGPEGQVIEPIAEFPDVAPEPPEPPAEPAYDAEPDVVAVEPAPFVAPITPRAPTRRGRGEGRSSNALMWAGAAGLVAALMAGLVVFREQVVRAWPASGEGYAALGLELAGGGLLLEGVKAQPAFLAGRPVLSVTGAIRNPRDTVLDTPPVRVTLFDKSGKAVAAKIARPADAAIPAKGRRHFNITLIDPPASARDLEVRFEAKGSAATAAAHAEPRPAPAAPNGQDTVHSSPSRPPAAPAPHGAAPPSPAAAEHG